MRIMVTGAAGFIGSWVADALTKAGHEVVAVDSLVGGAWSNLAYTPAARFTMDVAGEPFRQTDWRGVEAVYHCAALAYEGVSVFSPRLIANNIVTGTVAVAVAAIRAGAKRFVNCSSMARYGLADTPYREGMMCWPVDPYGAAKVAAETQLNILGQAHGVEVVHAVPHNVIGPRQKYDDPYRNVAAIMINRMLQGKQPVIYGDGTQKRCFSFIQDVLPVLLAMLDCEAKPGEVFNVGPDEEVVSVGDLASMIALLMEFHLEPIYMAPRPREVPEAWCSSAKIRRRFGYKTKTRLADGLLSMIEYIRQRGPRTFIYHMPLEIRTAQTPATWTEGLI